MTNTNTQRETKILIVEDQYWPRIILGKTLDQLMPNYCPSYQPGSYDNATNIRDAERKIREEKYGMIFLDHRLPEEDMGDLENRDMNSYSDSLRNVGYNRLLPLIAQHNPDATVIGTSSLSEQISIKPEHQIDKCRCRETLESVLKKLYTQRETKELKGGNE